MKKINVLIVPSDMYGVGMYRLIWPAQLIQSKYSDEINIRIKYQQPITKEDMEWADVYHYHRLITHNNNDVAFIKTLKENNITIVLDLDDYWSVPNSHGLAEVFRSSNVPERIVHGIKTADYVTTTTEVFAGYIREHNRNVIVLPNAINTAENMWTPNKKVKSELVRVGWVGGSSHKDDLAKLSGTVNRLNSDKELTGKFEMVMCGFDNRGTVTTTHPITKEQHTRKIRSGESVWLKFEESFNDYGRGDNYVRRNTLPINRYGEHYNYIDIALAPLVTSKFNDCKSELKVIEAGFMECAFIGSDVVTYNKLIDDGVNGYLIPEKKDHKLWYRYIKELIINEQKRNDMIAKLKEVVHNKYSLDLVTENRVQFYKEIAKCKNN